MAAASTVQRPRPWLRTKNGVRPRAGEYKTHCINGHEFTPENTFRDSRGARCCYICRMLSKRAYRKRQAAKAWKDTQ